MKLRTPRTELPSSTYKKDLIKLFHPLMFAPILMLVTIGTFLSNEVNYFVYLIELVGVSLGVICAYHLDEYREKVTAPNIPDYHNLFIAWISGFSGTFIGIYLCVTVTPILIIPIMIALMGIVLYNMDIIKSKVLYCLSWGGTPIFGSYMVQTGSWPNLTVILFTIFGMLLSVKLFWNWSLRTCGRASVCPKRWNLHICHSPGTVFCYDRQRMPKEVNDTMKVLQKLELLILLFLTIGVILI